MAKLAPMLERLTRHDDAAVRAGEGAAKLVLASGRRSRIEGDGDFETIGSAALSEDEVRDLLSQTGAGSRLDRLDARPTAWTFRHEGATFLAEAAIVGRELKATLRRSRGDEDARPVRPKTEDAPPAFREEFASKQRDPRSDDAAPRGGAVREAVNVRAKTHDPRADEEASPPPRSRAERRRESRARRLTPPPATATTPTAPATPATPHRDPTRAPTRRGTPSDDRLIAALMSKDVDPSRTKPNGGDPSRMRTLDVGGRSMHDAKPEADAGPRVADEDVWRSVVGGSRTSPIFNLSEPDDGPGPIGDPRPEAGRSETKGGAAPPPRSDGRKGNEARNNDAHTDLRKDHDLPPVFSFEEPRPLPPGLGAPRAPSAAPPPPIEVLRAPANPPASSWGGDWGEEKKPAPAKAPAIEITVEKAPAAKVPAEKAPVARAPAAATSGSARSAGEPRLDPKLGRLVEQARAAGASDLHLVAGRAALARLAGALRPAGEVLSVAAVEEMVLASIPKGRREAFDRDGAVTFAVVLSAGDDTTRCRVAVSKQRTGLKASIRILSKVMPTITDLELPLALDHATRHHQGLVIVSGPSGQGKTTTLAAMVDHLNTNTTHHILTVEDPIEYVHPRKKAMMSQREVGTHTKSFANALRSSLREDPDVIVVGELRDVETVRTALSAGETGHLVLGTLNTPNAAKTIDRLIDLFPPPEQPQVRATLAGALRLIASQRLLPRRDGSGRVAVVEVLPGSLALSNLIRDGRTFQIPSLMQRGRGAGVIRLDDELVELVRRGIIDRKDALAAADDPAELTTVLEGRAPKEGERPADPKRPPTGSPQDATAGGEGDDKGKALWQRAADIFRRGGNS